MMLKLLNRLILLSRPPVIVLSLLLVALLAVNAYAQITVKGTVTDSENYTGLPGVNVVIKGTATGTITDIDGNYTLEVPNGEAVLVFSSVGYSTFESKVGSRNVIDIPMIAETTALDEIVVVGYGTQQKVTVTGAVVDVKGA
jgi:hypothetical protein